MPLFFKKEQKPQKPMCVLLDSSTSRVVARGTLESPPDGLNIQVNITEGNAQDVINAEHVQIVPADESITPKLGHVISRRVNLLTLEPLRDLVGNEVRENLRMPVDFETFIYPTDGTPGRYRCKANDLSCGGISFFSIYEFTPGQLIEIVIPITRITPLLVPAKILRSKPDVGATFYAAQFQELLNEQESMIREAVFNVQLQSIQRARR